MTIIKQGKKIEYRGTLLHAIVYHNYMHLNDKYSGKPHDITNINIQCKYKYKKQK